MGRRSERLSGMLEPSRNSEGRPEIIRVISRAFDVLRCFENHEVRLGNLEISKRCCLPPSTVSRLTYTLTRVGELTYLPRDQKYQLVLSRVIDCKLFGTNQYAAKCVSFAEPLVAARDNANDPG
jgi:hypothetical protein